jgi:hypothetical protein
MLKAPMNQLDSGSFQQFLEAFEALPDKEKQEAIDFADKVTADMRFVPNVGPQTDAYFTEADELFFGGGGGGGKTSLLCGLPLNEHHDIQIFRREAPQLRGIVKELAQYIGSTDGFNSQTNVWRLPNGQVIELAGVKDEADKEKWQGRAADFKGFDEITHFSRSQYQFIIGWNRSTRKGQRCRVLATGNPPVTEEGLWVIAHWAPWLDDSHPDPAKPGELRWPVRANDDDDDLEIFFRTKEEAMAHMEKLATAPRDHKGRLLPPRSRTFIPARLEDNPDLMRSGYAAVLEAMPKELRDAMRDGKFKQTFADDEFQVIPTEWIVAAQKRWTKQKPNVPMTAMGADIAQGGVDRTTLAPRYGVWFDEVNTTPGVKTPDGATAAALILMHLRDGAQVNIDLGGGWGNSAYEHLVNNDAVNILGIVPSSAGTGYSSCKQMTFYNLRAKMWWQFREALDPSSGFDIALPPDPEVRAELAAPRWKMRRGNVILIEEKVEIKKRLGRSPDKGDSIVQSWYTRDNKVMRASRLADDKRLPSSANGGLNRTRAWRETRQRMSKRR